MRRCSGSTVASSILRTYRDDFDLLRSEVWEMPDGDNDARVLTPSLHQSERSACRTHRRHELLDIIAITVRAIISGAEAWTAIEEYGLAKQNWLARFLRLSNGIPSHDT